NAHSKQYTSPIVISDNVTIRAIAIAPRYTDSAVSTFSYTVASPVVTPIQKQIVLKITMDQLLYTINNQPAMFDVAPYQDTREWRSMIPMRFIAETFGAYVSWDDATMTQTISLKGRVFKITVGVPLPNGMGTARLVNDRLMVPLRYVSEQLGASVSWDETTRTNTITY
ncbi:MAG: chitobiase/beta-hexosaminidase C-terminal domain-containing protein, partial [Clostridiales bacterium]|nr:chitobiase/beta-hexosaminidase C-terminal domain-containing protein [Clostridiales bacterium]